MSSHYAIPGFPSSDAEWGIPPCMPEMRQANDADRVTMNPSYRIRSDHGFRQVSYESAGDGDMLFSCLGQVDCPGGTVKTDRHDILQTRLPETTAALSGICKARRKFYSDAGILRYYEDLDCAQDLSASDEP